MKKVRLYGHRPFTVAVVHGGPGAPGEMAPVANELSATVGVLEPLLTATTVAGQVLELDDILRDKGKLPVTLIGFSWGAMLSFIFTAQHPASVRKLILVSSGVFEDEYASDIMNTRLSRLSEEERKEVLSLTKALDSAVAKNKSAFMERFGALLAKADICDALPQKSEVVEYQYDVYRLVWEEASKLRSSGRLLETGREIQCPVVAIHGDYDPHPAQGVRDPLSRTLQDFRFISIPQCGHYPWQERNARNRFYDILKQEINS